MYVACYSLDRFGACIYFDQGLTMEFVSGPLDKHKAEMLCFEFNREKDK